MRVLPISLTFFDVRGTAPSVRREDLVAAFAFLVPDGPALAACLEVGSLMLDIVTSIDICRIYRPVFTGVRYFESIHGWRCHGPINFPAYTEIGRWADAGHQIFDIIILLIRSCSDGKYENTFCEEKKKY